MPDNHDEPVDPMLWLSRVDTRKTHGWQFRIERSELTERKFFSDSTYGSPEECLKVAQEHRDKFLVAARELGLVSNGDLSPRRGYLTGLTSNNTSGIIGVNRRVVVMSVRKGASVSV